MRTAAILIFSTFSATAYASGEISIGQKTGLLSFALIFCVSIALISISIYKYQRPSRWLGYANLIFLILLTSVYAAILAIGFTSTLYLNLLVLIVCGMQLIFFLKLKT